MSSIVPVNGIVFKRLRARKTPKYVPFKIYRKCISVSIFDSKIVWILYSSEYRLHRLGVGSCRAVFNLRRRKTMDLKLFN